jgi:hypothetical protein
MALNGISTETVTVGLIVDPVATKILRRTDKLNLAIAERTAIGTIGFRNLNTLVGTHPVFISTSTVASNLSGTASPTVGHPWS